MYTEVHYAERGLVVRQIDDTLFRPNIEVLNNTIIILLTTFNLRHNKTSLTLLTAPIILLLSLPTLNIHVLILRPMNYNNIPCTHHYKKIDL